MLQVNQDLYNKRLIIKFREVVLKASAEGKGFVE